ncbi:hypothetical protein EBU99_00065 [bacterium]|nr:hypothetical protein [bacterium]
MQKRRLSAFMGLGVLVCVAASQQEARAECKDMVLRMQDSSGKTAGREITMFLNCHEGSYLIPSASTINVFEWKEGRLCHGHRVCGNVRYWNGHFGVAGLWSWGNSVSDFTSNTKLVNRFKKLADGSPAGRGGDATAVATSAPNSNSGNTCINVNSQDARAYKLSSNSGSVRNGGVSANGGTAVGTGGNASLSQVASSEIDQNGFCVDKVQVNAIWNNRGIRINNTTYNGLGDAVDGLYGPQVRDDMQSEFDKDGRWMCFQGANNSQGQLGGARGGDGGAIADGGVALGGQGFVAIDDVFKAANISNVQTCAKDVQSQVDAPAVAVASGGNGGNGYSPIFGLKSGNSSTSGNVNTDYNDHALQVDFALDFGQIDRYCSAIRDEACF